MKKLSLSLLCIIGMLFFASCDPELINNLFAQKPNIEFVEEEGYISQNCQVEFGNPLAFHIRVSPNDSTDNALKKLTFTIVDIDNGQNVLFEDVIRIEENQHETLDFYETYTPQVAANLNISAIIEDSSETKNAADLVVDYFTPGVEIGKYEGNIQITGQLQSNNPTFDNTPFDSGDIFAKITLDSIPGTNKINATLDIDGTPINIKCEKNGNTVAFTEFHFIKSYVFITSIDLDFTVNMVATLRNDNAVLTLDGTTVAKGDIIDMLTIDMDGVLTGELIKK